MPAGCWPHIISVIAGLVLPFSQREKRPFWQNQHLPQAITEQTTTRSPPFQHNAFTDDPPPRSDSWPSPAACRLGLASSSSLCLALVPRRSPATTGFP